MLLSFCISVFGGPRQLKCGSRYSMPCSYFIHVFGILRSSIGFHSAWEHELQECTQEPSIGESAWAAGRSFSLGWRQCAESVGNCPDTALTVQEPQQGFAAVGFMHHGHSGFGVGQRVAQHFNSPGSFWRLAVSAFASQPLSWSRVSHRLSNRDGKTWVSEKRES